MYSINHHTPTARPREPQPKTPGTPGTTAAEATAVLRSYRRIAAILSAREHEHISPAEVEHVCRTAEAKIIRALLSDPDPRPRPWTDHTPGNPDTSGPTDTPGNPDTSRPAPGTPGTTRPSTGTSRPAPGNHGRDDESPWSNA